MITKRIQFLLVLLMAVAVVVASAKGPEGEKSRRLNKPGTNDLYTTFLINNIFAYYSNNGDGGYNPFLNAAGWEWPAGSGNTAIFEEGLVWGVYKPGINDAAHPMVVGGSAYRHGLQAGGIVSVGVPDAPGDPTNKIYNVRPDAGPTANYATASVKAAMDAAAALVARYEAGVTGSTMLGRYQTDWAAWPAAKGAPWYGPDLGVAAYNPAVDTPGVKGADQTIWYIANDLIPSRTTFTYGSNPIGIELQTTIWGYNRQGALGNTVFKRYRAINKSAYGTLDSTYMVQWSDPDLGDAGDDLAGGDTTRNLGFIYNGKARDAEYGDKPPAAGLVFFQGPAVPGAPTDSAAYKDHYILGKKNLGLTALPYFINGNATYTDPAQGVILGTLQWWRLMHGQISGTGGPFIDPTTGLAQVKTQCGDPVTHKGWTDQADPGDRRLCIVTGPYQFALNDTSEIVVGELVGVGGDRLSSIDVLRFYTDLAQNAYNVFFDLPNPPPSPQVSVVNLDGEIVLDWSTIAASNALETFTSKGYVFQGYNVYQALTSTGDGKKLLATYDVIDGVGKINDRDLDQTLGVVITKPVQFGNDNGVARTIDITSDPIRSKALSNYQRYYFAVTAYSYNAAGVPLSLESPLVWKEAVPQTGTPGQRFHASYADTVLPIHATGVASNSMSVEVVNPTALKAHDYQVQVIATDSVFNVDLGVNVANPKWQVYDVTTSQVVLAPSTKFGIASDNKVIDGFRIGLQATPFYTAGQEIASMTYQTQYRWNWRGVNAGLSQTNLPADPAGNPWGLAIDVGANFRGSTLLPQDVNVTVQVRFDSTGFNKAAGTGGQKCYMWLRTATGTAGALYQGFFPQPFTVWDITNPASPRQIDMAFLEAVATTTNDSVWAPGAGSGNREYFYFINRTYTSTPDPTYVVGASTEPIIATKPVLYSGWFTYNSASYPVYRNGDVWTITPTNILKTNDTWTFSLKTKAQTASTTLAKADVNKVNVVPNPYFGFSLLEPSKYVRFVTFTHLPDKATIRIFTLAGTLVRTLSKNDATQEFRWDLNNENGLPVSAGMYVAYVDMPTLGTTKVLKLAIIPEAQILDHL